LVLVQSPVLLSEALKMKLLLIGIAFLCLFLVISLALARWLGLSIRTESDRPRGLWRR